MSPHKCHPHLCLTLVIQIHNELVIMNYYFSINFLFKKIKYFYENQDGNPKLEFADQKIRIKIQ